ncbi:MAG: galactose-1-phosphate uridylyltransferase [Actinobacteria bacterium]|nr:galactose-1-phosphate uridylyltransferase [Actinomycetota bacterium]NCW94030.1 galactose-1-phosphate uridylyltransferase [Actinomycetota bacterium]NDE12874.1 galactose-1-phosphate uridylyltransferase [Actinomycetota bacterium]
MGIMSGKKLGAGVVRTDRLLMDGRTIRYYDTQGQSRTAEDQREPETQPKIGEMRLDPLNNEWVVMAAHRQNRIFLPPKDLNPLAPSRPGFLTEIPESDYEVVVFDNRSPSLRDTDAPITIPTELTLDTPPVPAAGKCEVVCFTSNYDASFKDLSTRQIRTVLEAWRDRVSELSTIKYIEHIAPFENRGEEVGVTLAHPHGQIYAYPNLPVKTAQMLAVATAHKKRTGRVLLDEVVARELKDKVRIVCENEEWVAYVPYAARYPFEIHVAPKRSVPDLAALDEKSCDAFPEIAKEVLQRLDGVFDTKMAYIAAWHQAPVRVGRDVMRLHWQITSVRRAPGKLKYLAGSESAFGAFMMDVWPEQSAEQLRGVKI